MMVMKKNNPVIAAKAGNGAAGAWGRGVCFAGMAGGGPHGWRFFSRRLRAVSVVLMAGK
jgi:hypothetical protein